MPVTYVEIGCWTGDSACYVAEHVLTNKHAKGFGIDPYTAISKLPQEEMDEVCIIARQNMAATGFRNWTWVRQPSISALSSVKFGPIDVLYIDGLHNALNATLDFALAWPHLVEGAGVIFDDYGLGMRRRIAHVPEAVGAIQLIWGNLLEPWGEDHIGKQAYFKVRAKEIDESWTRNQRKYQDAHDYVRNRLTGTSREGGNAL
ncbi:class I SAM-dependent methyltransferase [Gammaproteobacteria bacterium]|nr:class I SAM-dependent methyltransferase [Gammaproteobacteria bacterium]